MNKIFLSILFIFLITTEAKAMPSEVYFNKVVDCIYKVEGGAKTKYPYGIKSIHTNGDKVYARQVCLTTVRNNYRRWNDAGNPGSYLDFLGDRYCPPSSDKIGNARWKKNIKLMLTQKSIGI